VQYKSSYDSVIMMMANFNNISAAALTPPPTILPRYVAHYHCSTRLTASLIKWDLNPMRRAQTAMAHFYEPPHHSRRSRTSKVSLSLTHSLCGDDNLIFRLRT